MEIILDGKTCAESVYIELAKSSKIANSGLAIITIGDDAASKVYVRNKTRACDKIGLYWVHSTLPPESSTDLVIEIINQFNNDNSITGIIVQLPVPPQIDVKAVQMAIAPNKDVDGFRADSPYLPCTPEGILYLLKYYDISITQQRCVILGRSDIVGKPMARMLTNLDNTVSLCHSKTEVSYRNMLLREADIIISAVGKQDLIMPRDMIYEDYGSIGWHGSVIVDVGINRDSDGKICGDVNPGCYKYTKAYTPVPGGVGQTTVMMLLKHTIEGPTSLDEYKKG